MFIKNSDYIFYILLLVAMPQFTAIAATPATALQALTDAKLDTLPPCSSLEGFGVDTISWVNNWVKSGRPDLQVISKSSYPGGSVLSNPITLSAVQKGAILPCHPAIYTGDDPSQRAKNPINVQTVMRVMDSHVTQIATNPSQTIASGGAALFTTLINPAKYGVFDNPGGPTTPGYITPAPPTYADFLDLVGRFPYFCGEPGTWQTIDQACQRELATFFAHAAQEVSDGTTALERLTNILSFTRESTCFGLSPDGTSDPKLVDLKQTKCTQYQTGASNVTPPATDTTWYYGRGIKQLSYYFNYMGASSALLGDYSVLLKNPDLVAQNGYLSVGIGFWYAMTPQSSKPTMHDTTVGTYSPIAPLATNPGDSTLYTQSNPGVGGVYSDSKGGTFDRFSVTVSTINGAIECSPEFNLGAFNFTTPANYGGAGLSAAEQATINGIIQTEINNYNRAWYTNGAIVGRISALLAAAANPALAKTQLTNSINAIPSNQTRSNNRFTYYLAMLGMLNVTQLTAVESAYGASTYCKLDNGNPFANAVTSNPGTIAYRPEVNLGTDGSLGSSGSASCTTTAAWDIIPPLTIFNSSNFTACLGYFSPIQKPTVDETCFLTWAEKTYPNSLQPTGGANRIRKVTSAINSTFNYIYAYYPTSNAFLGYDNNTGEIYYDGPDGVMQDEGTYSDLLKKAGCSK